MGGTLHVVRWAGWVTAALVVTLVLCGSNRAGVVKGRKMVSLKVTAVRGSKEGEESIDPRLAELGEKLKKKFKLRRLEVIDETNFGANSGIEITTNLGDDMKIKMRWSGTRQDSAQFRITVLRGEETVIQERLKIELNSMALATGRLDKDILILVMTASLIDE